ncbi:MAG: glycosyltransferase family 4 protein [Chloroflexi bacterium]|nr:glycosyltransferase family 4 protein [Chloroflexota bacterium]
MKVDLVCRPARGSSGVGRYASSLHQELQSLGIEAELVYPLPLPLALGQLARRCGLDASSFFSSYPFRVAYRSGALRHLTAQQFATALLTEPADVITVHDLFPQDAPRGAGAAVARVLDALGHAALRRSRAVVVDSAYTGQQLRQRRLVREDRLHVVPLGVDLRQMHPQEDPGSVLERLGVDRHQPFVLYVGTEAPRKRVDLVLWALGALKLRTGSAPTLVKVGAPVYVEARRRHRVLTQAWGIAAQVVWADHVSDEELAALYSAALCYVSASAEEGFGLPLLEALACGCPVLCSGIPPHREICGEAAHYVPPASDGWEWAAHLALALDSFASQGKHLRERARERALAFSWRHTAERMVEVYESVC